MSEEYDHERQRAATDKAERVTEAERRKLRKAIVERRDRNVQPERPVEVETVRPKPEDVTVPTPDPAETAGDAE